MKKLVNFLWQTSISLIVSCIGQTIGQTTAAEWPYNSKATFPYSTFAPININSSATILLVAPPVEFTNVLFDTSRVVNTGKAVEAYLSARNTTSSISGGPLFQNRYRFYKVRIYWNHKKGPCRTTVDGKGQPLEVIFIYYKVEYGSFENALFHRDGLAITSTRITLQPRHNLFFYPIRSILNKLQKPGSNAQIFNFIFYALFNVITLSQYYYTYPGSYTDLQTGKQYMSSIELVFEPVVGYISNEQFSAFQHLKNSFGAPLENTSPIFPAGSRPILKGTGTCSLKFTLT